MEPLFIDFETRSPVDLKMAGLMRYALHPLTEAMCMAWAFGDEEFQVWTPGDLPAPVRNHVAGGGLVVAHNAQFELALWNFVMSRRFKWPRLTIAQTRCTMAACYAQALPGALENAAHALGLKVAKDIEGRALMLKMCKPKGYTQDGAPIYHDSPEDRKRLGEYCAVDGVVEREIWKRVLPLSDQEQRVWAMDQAINLRGVPFDTTSIRAAMTVAASEKERLDGEMGKATAGAVQACTNVGALKEWAGDFGVLPESLAKAELAELLGFESLPEPVKVALKLRQDAGRFTSISKLKAIMEREVGSRVFYLFQYHAATTGRFAGRAVQPHNFTRDLPEPAVVEDILRHLREGNVAWIDMLYGQPSIMISKCLRGFIHAADGNTFLGGDFSNVEGRGIAWLAGEEWKLDAFRKYDTIIGYDEKGEPKRAGPDLYNLAYAKTFNVDIASVTKEQRQIGKVEELAFGYQGGMGAFHTMGKTYGVNVPDHKAEEFKLGWRSAHPRIKQYWYDLQNAAIGAVTNPGEITKAGAAGREVMFRTRGSFLWCRLPSGRTLCYPYPSVISDDYGPKLTFKSVPDATVWATFVGQKERGEFNTTYIIDEPTNTKEWCRISTYGGKLAENITQAICRDILVEAMLRVEAAGYQTVLHVHDEIIVEGGYTEASRQEFEKLMSVVPAWAAGFPIAAGCWLSARYIKG